MIGPRAAYRRAGPCQCAPSLTAHQISFRRARSFRSFARRAEIRVHLVFGCSLWRSRRCGGRQGAARLLRVAPANGDGLLAVGCWEHSDDERSSSSRSTRDAMDTGFTSDEGSLSRQDRRPGAADDGTRHARSGEETAPLTTIRCRRRFRRTMCYRRRGVRGSVLGR